MTELPNRRLATPPFEHHHAYAGLYKAVILRAVQDLAHKQYQDEAREWLVSPDSDYAFATAGIRPNCIRQQMI